MILGIGGGFTFRYKKRSHHEFHSNIFSVVDTKRLFSDDYWFLTGRLILVSLMLMTIPICVHVTRDYIESIIRILNKQQQNQNNSDIINPIKKNLETQIQITTKEKNIGESVGNNLIKKINNPSSNNFIIKHFTMTKLEYVISICTFIFIMAISILLIRFDKNGGIDNVIGIVGNYGTASIAFVLPPIIYLKTFNLKESSIINSICVFIVFLFGIFIWGYQTMETFIWKR